jgi:DNA-binding transcriptional regulator LsrR (DeoR family)
VSDPELYRIDRLHKVAKAFYDDGRSIPSIRDELRIEMGRPKLDKRTVAKMVQKARQDGIVVIEFPENVSQERHLENKLQSSYPHLHRVIVTKDEPQYGDLLKRWGEAAAKYFDELVAEGRPDGRPLHVGISGGETLLAFVNAVKEQPRRHVHIHTTALIGRGQLPSTASHVDPLVNATILWTKCGRVPGHCHYATVPPYDALTREQIASELHNLSQRQPIREVIKDMGNIHVAFTGLGLVKPKGPNPEQRNQLTMTGLLERIVTPDQLEAEHAVGDFSYCLFDENGNWSKKWQFFLTAGHGDPARQGVAFYQQMVNDRKEKRKVVAIAGSLKEGAILPALRAKLFNVWITDTDTAKWVLRKG